jgi:hypothetical protein
MIARGFDAVSCDLRKSERPGPHIVGDVLEHLNGWDGMIAHPDCTYVCSSGLHWNGRVPGRADKTEAAVEFALKLWNAPIPMICLENPIGRLGRVLPANLRQIIQPHQFGHDASKATCLWLKNLPRLKPTKHIPPRMVNGKPRWANQTDNGQNRLGPSETRWLDRARTYQGVADAFADQFGAWVLRERRAA